MMQRGLVAIYILTNFNRGRGLPRSATESFNKGVCFYRHISYGSRIFHLGAPTQWGAQTYDVGTFWQKCMQKQKNWVPLGGGAIKFHKYARMIIYDSMFIHLCTAHCLYNFT